MKLASVASLADSLYLELSVHEHGFQNRICVYM